MSIPTTMKFIVRGKSVDFINREGSSPSIPNKKKKGPVLFPNSFFFVSDSNLVMFLIHSIVLQIPNGSAQKSFSLTTSLVICDIYICTNEHL